MNEDITEHSIFKSISLHLLPGLLVSICYYALAPRLTRIGYPSIMALIIAGTIVLIPFELGFLLIQQRKMKEKFFDGTIKFLKPLPSWQYFIFVPVVLILSGILFKIFGFSSKALFRFFQWIPSNYIMNMGIEGDFEKSKLIITYCLFLIFIVIILPITEELYFRGYLLPRMPKEFKGWTDIIHSGLFALYHFWTPWLFITRTLGVLPLICIVRRKENIKLGIISHCILNSMDFFLGISLILKM
jgi:membrane protease YdiL (CAAX protease family)